jgi:hypothetical protein
MSEPPPRDALRPDHQAELEHAVRLLERSSLALRVADYAGQPVNRVIGLLPGAANRQFTKLLEAAILKCLEIAIGSLDTEPAAPSPWLGKLMTGMTGGVGGFFGFAALPIELPLTTTLMLRSIAEIARHTGEDLAQPDAGLACLEVFALGGGRRTGRRADIGYYATRAVLGRLTGEVAAMAVHHRTIDVASPMVGRLVGEIAARFGVAMSERAAASAVPILGALGGAGVNMIFMTHFQRIAEGHFLVRRLERQYGADVVRERFEAATRSLSETPR